jgi:hypothetical protein
MLGQELAGMTGADGRRIWGSDDDGTAWPPIGKAAVGDADMIVRIVWIGPSPFLN